MFSFDSLPLQMLLAISLLPPFYSISISASRLSSERLQRSHNHVLETRAQLDYSVALLLMAFLSIALYNVLELTVLAFTTFKRWRGLYFYSTLVATAGVMTFAIGQMLRIYQFTSSSTLNNTLIMIGWPCMVTGQSLVLYSRVHLLYRSRAERARWILYMIILDAFIGHVPCYVMIYGSSSSSPTSFKRALAVYEKIQMTIFFLQETIISSLYIYLTCGLLRSDCGARGRNGKRLLRHLIMVNTTVIMLDLTLLGIEFAGYYDIETAYKAAVYSIKLKMEFSILNQLLAFFRRPFKGSNFTSPEQSRCNASTSAASVITSAPIARAARTGSPVQSNEGHQTIEKQTETRNKVNGRPAKSVSDDVEMQGIST